MARNNEHRNAPSGGGLRSLRGLIALNAVLLIILAAVNFGSAAQGQARGRGEYTMVAGGVSGSDSAAVYIIDVANQEMIAMTYEPNAKVLEGIGYRHLGADAGNLQRGRTRPTP